MTDKDREQKRRVPAGGDLPAAALLPVPHGAVSGGGEAPLLLGGAGPLPGRGGGGAGGQPGLQVGGQHPHRHPAGPGGLTVISVY